MPVFTARFRPHALLALLFLIAAPAYSTAGEDSPAKLPAVENALPDSAIKAEPVKAEPVKAEPARAEPAKAEPAKAGPAKAEPMRTEPVAKGLEAKSNTVPSADEPVARINDTLITRGEVTRTIKAILAQNRQGQDLSPDRMKQAEESTLDNLIAAELLYQAGVKLEVKDIDKQVEAKIAQGKSRFPSTTEFEKALKANGLTEKELTEYTRKDIVISNLLAKEVDPKIAVSDDEAKKFYDDNSDRFKMPETVKASHILIGVDGKATAEEKQKAKEKATELLKKLKDGGNFAALAKAESTCPSSAEGGDLGSFGRGQMVAPFEEAVFALKPGEMSNVVETPFGYHIIKLTEKKAAETTTFTDAHNKIREYLKGQKMQQAVITYVAGLKEKAKVEKLAQK